MIAAEHQPTEREKALSAHARRKAFHRDIEAKAAALRALMPPMKKPWFEVLDVVPLRPMERIKRAACEHFKVTFTDLISDRRTLDIILPRHVAMYLCKRLTTETLPGIGRAFGGRDHTTVLSGCRKIERLRAEGDKTLVAALASICGMLNEQVPASQRPLVPSSHDAEVMRMWDLGFNTAAIAKKTKRKEAVIVARLDALREAARG